MYSVNSTEVVNCLWANPLDSSCPPGTIRAVGPGSENGLIQRGRESALKTEKRGMILPLWRETFSILCRLLWSFQTMHLSKHVFFFLLFKYQTIHCMCCFSSLFFPLIVQSLNILRVQTCHIVGYL